MPRVSPDFVANTVVPVPPTEAQGAIADFLDRETAKIDALIAKKAHVLELLNEQYRALAAAVLLPGVPLGARDRSDINISRVPRGWVVRRLKFVAALQRGFDLPAEDREPGVVPIVSSGGICGTHARAAVRGPGVVTGRYGTVGDVYYVEEDFWPLNTALYVREFYGNEPLFIKMLLEVLPLESEAAKSAVPGIDRKDVSDLLCLVPPISEQRRLVQELSAAKAESLRVRRPVDFAIDRLREYRSALITAAVTGQVDVRDAIA